MTLAVVIAFCGLAVAAALCLLRVLRGPTIAERMVALDLLLLLTASGIGVDTARSGESLNVDVLVVTALLGFVGTGLTARFLERQGEPDG